MKTVPANSLPQLDFYRYLIGTVGPDATPERLGEYVLVDFVGRRSKRVS